MISNYSDLSVTNYIFLVISKTGITLTICCRLVVLIDWTLSGEKTPRQRFPPPEFVSYLFRLIRSGGGKGNFDIIKPNLSD